jgi:uncharacterized Ntn-hydrolase superfamily protein
VQVVSTFSIVAFDPDGAEWGVAVASKFLAVGSVVPWAKAGVGAVATQAFANIKYGPEGLDLMADGRSAEEAIAELISADEGSEHRQVGVVDSQGRAATYTGESCFDWAGGLTGDHFAIQGNILTGSEVVESMRDSFVATKGPLADRLLEALMAGDRSGGDSRGRQSAAVLLVKEAGGYLGMTDKALDLRVDDHPDPVPELRRLRSLHRLYLEAPAPDSAIDIDEQIAGEIRRILTAQGAFSGPTEGGFDEDLEKALRDWMGIENLEMRWLGGPKIDRHVLEYIRSKTKA